MQAISDLFLDGRAKVSSYRAMLESLLETGLPSITHREAWSRQSPAERYLCVRHDVDHDLEKALRMARVEHALGMRASYYLLPPGDYDKSENYYGRIVGSRIVHSARLSEVALEISGLGHEIGLHNDFLQLSCLLGRPPAELIAEQLAHFRDAGIEVTGTASHGSRFARDRGYVNYELFAECLRARSVRRSVDLGQGAAFELFSVAMTELGLEYEAYSLKRDLYISDTGSRMYVGGTYLDTVQPTMFVDLAGGAAKVIALFHPEWWTVADRRQATLRRVHGLFHSAAWSAAGRGLAALRRMRRLFRPARKSVGGAADVAQPAVAMPSSIVLPAPAHASDAPAAVDRVGLQPAFVRPDGRPFRIGVRGDCCSRRAVVMNRDLFPCGVELIIDEKCPNSCFVDTLRGRGAAREQGEALCDVSTMTATLKHYFLGQFERQVLQAEDLDLLLLDSYSDMNFELWRHRAEGWALWVHPKHLREPDALSRDFVKLGQTSLDDAVQAICTVIDHVRLRNPGVPVLILHQPFEYYPKLEKRREFHQLGERVAAARAGVVHAAALAREELVPADLGSCGPGQTLHFDGPTYRKMLDDAWRRGLGALLRDAAAKRAAIAQGGRGVPAATPVPASGPATPEHTARSDERVHIGYGQGRAECLPGCTAAVDAAFKTYAQYFRHPEIDGHAAPEPRYTPMLIAVDEIGDFAAWEARIKKFGNGARLRQKRKAAALGYYVKLFGWRQHVPDVHDVNHSKAVRSGGAMRGSYLRSVEEMGGAPDRPYAPAMPACPHHWGLSFGVFLEEPGHMQGTVQVDERLLAYLWLRRCGDVALYSQILGHGDHLVHGILVLLHHEVVRWVSEHLDGPARGLRFLMYGGQQNGGDSLFQFKRQSGFTAHPVWAFRGAMTAPESAAGAATEVPA